METNNRLFCIWLLGTTTKVSITVKLQQYKNGRGVNIKTDSANSHGEYMKQLQFLRDILIE